MNERRVKDQQTWLKALEGDDYQQCDEKLKHADSYCCLGVALELFGEGEWHESAGTTEWFPEDGGRDGQYFESYMPDSDWQALGLYSNSGELIVPADEPDSAVYIVHIGDGLGVSNIQLMDESESAELIDRGFVLSRVENLAELNDQGCSFKQIAAFARSNPNAVFSPEED